MRNRSAFLIPVLAGVFLCFPVVAALAFNLPDTGQTECYQGVPPYGVIPCAGTGQDGAYSIHPMSFTDNTDGTVTDRNTGLVWQQQDDGNAYNWYRASGTYDATKNPESADVCGSLVLGDDSDWRLPTKNELMSIVDFGTPFPIKIDTQYFTGTIAFYYWSATPVASSLSSAWAGDFHNGFVDYYGKTEEWRVRCVRGGQPATVDHFIDRNDGTVLDTNTGLVWQKSEPGEMTWPSALLYCEGLDLGTSLDWRLPNIKELESLADVTSWRPAIDRAYFPDAALSAYHSSTSRVGYLYGTWGVDFYQGAVMPQSRSSMPQVRCVRGGQYGSFNQAPVTSADVATTDEDTVVEIPVLLNDRDPDVDSLAVESVGTPSHGIATTNGSTVTYTPTANWSGSDTFSYTVSDGRGGADTAMVTVTVIAGNDPPTIGALTPSALNTTPDSAQSFSAVYGDVDGYGDIRQVNLLINSIATSAGAINISYVRATNKLYLRNDADTSWGTGVVVGPGMATLSNGQGTVEGCAVAGAGNNLTLNVTITPKSAFAARKMKNVYLSATDNAKLSTLWVDKGDWTIFANAAPALGSITPTPGTSPPGVARSFSAVYSDANGYADLKQVKLLINASANNLNAISLYYDRAKNMLYLKNDANTSWGTGVVVRPGMTALSNSQGTIENCMVVGAGNDLILNVTVTPKLAFASAIKKNLYLNATDWSNTTTTWPDKGDWTIN